MGGRVSLLLFYKDGFGIELPRKVGWVVGFYGISTLVVILCQIHFYTNNQFYFKQFRLAWVLSLIIKNISI